MSHRTPVQRTFLWPVLFTVALAFAMVWAVKVGLAGEWQDRWAWPLLGFALTLFLARAGLALVGFRGDFALLALGFLLAGIGLAVQFRFGTLALDDLKRLSNYALPIGALALVFTVALFRGSRASALSSFAIPAALLSLAVLGAMLALGRRFRGAVYLEGFLNPTEIVKVLLVLYAAQVLTAFRKEFEKPVFPGIPAFSAGLITSLAAFWLLPMLLLAVIRDLGMIALLNGTLLVMLVLMTGRVGYLLAGLGALAGAGVLIWKFVPHGAGRLDVWLNPFSDPTGRGWQILQGLSAMASGGLWGAGLGAGHPTTVPIAASDFVYAALAEEMGFVGCGLVLLAYLLLFHRGYRIADSLKDPFQQALATGLTTVLALQTLFNIGGVTKALPLTGLTLPFISHGGSSLVTSFLILGLLLAMSDAGRKR